MCVSDTRGKKALDAEFFLPPKPKRRQSRFLANELLSEIDAGEMLHNPIGGDRNSHDHHERHQPPAFLRIPHKMIGDEEGTHQPQFAVPSQRGPYRGAQERGKQERNETPEEWAIQGSGGETLVAPTN